MDFVSADQGGVYDAAPHTVTWTIANAAASAEGTVSLSVKGDGVFAPHYGNGNGVVVAQSGTTATIRFENEFYEIPSGYYFEGALTITKKMLGADGRAIGSNETFYAGIFADAARPRQYRQVMRHRSQCT